jgi:hypothetical protein
VIDLLFFSRATTAFMSSFWRRGYRTEDKEIGLRRFILNSKINAALRESPASNTRSLARIQRGMRGDEGPRGASFSNVTGGHLDDQLR